MWFGRNGFGAAADGSGYKLAVSATPSPATRVIGPDVNDSDDGVIAADVPAWVTLAAAVRIETQFSAAAVVGAAAANVAAVDVVVIASVGVAVEKLDDFFGGKSSASSISSWMSWRFFFRPLFDFFGVSDDDDGGDVWGSIFFVSFEDFKVVPADWRVFLKLTRI